MRESPSHLADADFRVQAEDQRLGDGPIDADYHQKMKELAMVLDGFLNQDAKGKDRTAGFVLMVFPFGDRSGRCNYISNGADRKDVVKLMREMIARFEEGGR